MVEEIRKIILNQGELAMALEAFRRTNPQFLPAGKLVHCEVSSPTALKVAIEVVYGSTVQAMEIALESDSLLDPIIKFCIENNIVLPRSGRKIIKIKDNKLVLHVTIADTANEFIVIQTPPPWEHAFPSVPKTVH